MLGAVVAAGWFLTLRDSFLPWGLLTALALAATGAWVSATAERADDDSGR